ncbi:MAG: protein phosphatase [Armatimonadota bacterium]|nr:MAG: protein phosphatase [Armatimonadota bacterium]
MFPSGKGSRALPLPPVRQLPGKLRVRAYALSATGRRLTNEDAFVCVVDPPSPEWVQGLFIVADGIGGRQNGQIASSVAVRAAREAVLGAEGFFSPERARDALLEAFRRADREVYKVSRTDPLLDGMGTTLTVALLAQRRLFVASLGDSRAYLHRGRRLVQLTDDDWMRTCAEALPPGGDGVPDQDLTVVTRAVGWGDDELAPQTIQIEVGAEDLILVCTDGLWDGLSERQIEEALHRHGKHPDVCVRRVVQMAAARPDADNVTAIVARLEQA